MIVSQPKAGKTTLLKEIAKSVTKGNPDMHLIILLIDEKMCIRDSDGAVLLPVCGGIFRKGCG